MCEHIVLHPTGAGCAGNKKGVHMKNSLYAAIASCLAMVVTSSMIAFATAAPTQTESHHVAMADEAPAIADIEAELSAHIHGVIDNRLAALKMRLASR